MNAYRFTQFIRHTHIHTNLRRVCVSTRATNFWKNKLMILFPLHTHTLQGETRVYTNRHLITDLSCLKAVLVGCAVQEGETLLCYLMCSLLALPASNQIPQITSAPCNWLCCCCTLLYPLLWIIQPHITTAILQGAPGGGYTHFLFFYFGCLSVCLYFLYSWLKYFPYWKVMQHVCRHTVRMIHLLLCNMYKCQWQLSVRWVGIHWWWGSPLMTHTGQMRTIPTRASWGFHLRKAGSVFLCVSSPPIWPSSALPLSFLVKKA